MNFKKKNLFLSLIPICLLFLSSCGRDFFTFPSAKDVPIDSRKRVEKNIEEGRGVTLGGLGKGKKGGVFDFASSNEMWRASIEILDFVSLSNASYSGGIIITDWFSGNSEDTANNRELKITVKFLSNEVRADGLEIIIHEKICLNSNVSNCNIQKINSEISSELKLAILKKATIYKKEGFEKSSEEVRKKRKINIENQ